MVVCGRWEVGGREMVAVERVVVVSGDLGGGIKRHGVVSDRRGFFLGLLMSCTVKGETEQHN